MKIISILILFLSGYVSAFDYASYQEISFTAVIHEHGADYEENIDIGISGIPFKYKTKVVFTDAFRPVDGKRLDFIKNWAKALRQPPEVPGLYKKEVLINAAGLEIWIPMQDPVLSFMRDELVQGQEFYLYYVLVGAMHGELFYLGTDFQLH